MTATPNTTPAAQEAPPPHGKAFVVLLVFAAAVGVVVSLATWCFLEAVHQLQVGVFDKLPEQLGYDGGAPMWWPLPVCGIAGLLVALAITRLPGHGGHIPAMGLGGGGSQPIEVPGILLAALASVGLGLVLGPEAPLIGLGSGLGVLAVRLARKDAPPAVATVVAAAGSFAAMSFLFEAPVIAAVLLIEASGIGGKQLPLVLLPGLLAAGIGSLVSIGLGAFTGLSTSSYAIGALPLAPLKSPTVAEFAWTIPLAIAITLLCLVTLVIGRHVHPLVMRAPLALAPVAGIVVAGIAILFAQITDKGFDEVLFSGEDAVGPLAADAGTWSVGALVAVILCKSAAWGISMGSFRGGPTFPAIFVGTAAGVLASHLPGMAMTPAVAVGVGVGVVAVLQLPLSAVILATLLATEGGVADTPLVIVGVVVAYVLTSALAPRVEAASPAPAKAAAPEGDAVAAPPDAATAGA